MAFHFFNLPLHLFLLGLALLVAVRLMHGDPWSPPREGVLTWLHLAAWACLWTTLVAAVGFMVIGIPLSLPIVLIGLVYLVQAVVSYFSRRKNLLLRTLSLAAQHGLPLARAVHALSNEGRRGYHRRMAALADQLAAGVSLADAGRSRRTRGLVPRAAPVAIQVGTQTGRLPQALAELADSTDAIGQVRANAVAAMMYACGILTTGLLTISFFSVKLAPTLIRLFDEFDVTVSTLWTGDMLRWFSNPTFQAITMALAVCGLLLFAVLLISNLARAFPSLNYLDRRQTSPRGGLLLSLLAKPVEAGLPLLPTVQLLARGFPDRQARWRLTRSERAMLAGEEPLAALGKCKLVSPRELALLAAAQRVGNLPWAMRQAATLRDHRWSQRTARRAQIIWGFGLVTLGVPVVIFALVTLWPIIAVIERLALP